MRLWSYVLEAFSPPHIGRQFGYGWPRRLEARMNARRVRYTVIAGLLALSAPLGAAEPEKRVDVKHLNCKDFGALPDDIRPMLVAWVHGYSHVSGGSWLLDSARARSFVSSVQEKCEKAPQASFRYQVLQVAKERQVEQEKKD